MVAESKAIYKSKYVEQPVVPPLLPDQKDENAREDDQRVEAVHLSDKTLRPEISRYRQGQSGNGRREPVAGEFDDNEGQQE